MFTFSLYFYLNPGICRYISSGPGLFLDLKAHVHVGVIHYVHIRSLRSFFIDDDILMTSCEILSKKNNAGLMRVICAYMSLDPVK